MSRLPPRVGVAPQGRVSVGHSEADRTAKKTGVTLAQLYRRAAPPPGHPPPNPGGPRGEPGPPRTGRAPSFPCLSGSRRTARAGPRAEWIGAAARAAALRKPEEDSLATDGDRRQVAVSGERAVGRAAAKCMQDGDRSVGERRGERVGKYRAVSGGAGRRRAI